MTDDNYDPDDPDNFADVDVMAGKEDDEELEISEEDIKEMDDESEDEAV